jgi:uncharacterized protein with PIN domain
MKPKRTILALDEPRHLSWLAVVLRTHGFRVVACENEAQREEMAKSMPVDLLLVGPRMNTETRLMGDRVLLRHADWSTAELMEFIRIALVRKRGPKKPVVNESERNAQGRWVGKAAGR